MNELVKNITYESFDLEKVTVKTFVDESIGIETTEITFYLEDGSFKIYSFERQM